MVHVTCIYKSLTDIRILIRILLDNIIWNDNYDIMWQIHDMSHCGQNSDAYNFY